MTTATATAVAAYPADWAEVLAAPAFVINMDRCPERLAATMAALAAAGFTNVQRWTAVDATVPGALEAGWARHGQPRLDPSDPEFCTTYKGKQGCMLSHLDLMKYVIDADLPYFLVFEDDILFHPEFAELAPHYYAKTPRDYDLLYLGSQLDMPLCPYAIARVPVFCTNAMAFTAAGVRRIYDFLLAAPEGVRTIDCMLKDYQTERFFRPAETPALWNWYAWNAKMFPTEMAKMDKDWTKRNTGLVFQDVRFGSDVRPW